MINGLKQLKRGDTIYSDYYFDYYKVTHKRTGDSYLAKISDGRFIEEINIIPLLDHPSISKFIFYSLYDFKKEKKPTLITEYCSQGRLSEIIYKQPSVLSDTNKLILIYGIASGMSYLHSHDILHCDLKTSNIWLDYRYFPKINGFDISERINNEYHEEKRHIRGTPAYLSPEIYKYEGKSKKSDVYSYSLLIYEILHNKRIFEEINDIKDLRNKIINNVRPNISSNISNKYKELIERCWNEDPFLRPTFEDIVNELETDVEYITNNIDEEEYRKYIKYIKKSKITYGISDNAPNTKDIIQSIEKDRYLYEPQFRGIYETEITNIEYFLNEVDYDNYQKIKTTVSNYEYSISTYEDKITHQKYTVTKLKYDRVSFYQYFNINLFIKDNPCILKFNGYFIKNEIIRPLFNYCPNNTLSRVIELQQGDKCQYLTDTNKLVIIYGIASAISYLHSLNILHLDLRPDIIYLDNHLHPKVGGFYSSLRIPNHVEYLKFSIVTYYERGFHALHDSPEYINDIKVSKSYDVYSFSMVLYEILTEDKIQIGEKHEDRFKVGIKITKGERPKFQKHIPEYYRDLIERCWSSDPTKRPTFEDIVKELETNPSFINENIDKTQYFKYIEDIKRETNESKTEKTNEPKLHSVKIEHCQIETESSAKQITELSLNDFEIVKIKKNKKVDGNENLNEKLDKSEAKNANKFIEIENNAQENLKEEKKKLNENIIDIEEQKEMNKNIDINEVSIYLNQKEGKKSKVYENEKTNETTSIQNDNLITDESDKKTNKSTEKIELMKSKKIDEFEKINEIETAQTTDNIIKESIQNNNLISEKSSEKADKNAQKIEEYGKINENEVGENKQSSNKASFIEENEDLIVNFQKQEKNNVILETIEDNNLHKYNELDSKDVNNHNKSEDNVDELIEKFIVTNQMRDLFVFLIQHNYSNEKISSIFDYVYKNSRENYESLCEEGISQNNCVAHHKQALNLICKGKDIKDEKIKTSYFNESLAHFEESIHQGFIESYYSLSLLYHEFLKNDESAIKCAKEGLEAGDCKSKLLFGYYKIRGIGMKKNRQEGIKYILESGMENVHQYFATDIGLFYVEQHEKTKSINNEGDQEKDDEIDENSMKAFECFLKAFENHKTKATINNYGLCFLNGFGVQKNIQKAFEIFQEGSKLGDSNSKYHLSFIYYHHFNDPIKSQKYLKEASDDGHLYAKQQYFKMIYNVNKSFINNDEQNKTQTLNEDKEISAENEKSCVYLAKKYSKENDAERTYIYMKKCIEEKRSEVVLEYAINLYKHKKFKESKKYFDFLIKINHPIARYFEGVMKYFGQGCHENRIESERIMRNLAESGIDCASEFLSNYFNI